MQAWTLRRGATPAPAPQLDLTAPIDLGPLTDPTPRNLDRIRQMRERAERQPIQDEVAQLEWSYWRLREDAFIREAREAQEAREIIEARAEKVPGTPHARPFGRFHRPLQGKGKALLLDYVGNFLKRRGPEDLGAGVREE